MSIDTWYKVLGWDNLPNFGDCHTILEHSRFLENYAQTHDIKRLKRNLLETLTGKFEMQYIRLMGNPGAGKTSFLYSLLKDGNGNDSNIKRLLEQFVFYVFHVNRADSKEFEETIQREIKQAWQNYYNAVDLADMFLSITARPSMSIKEQLNELSTYFKNNRDKFSSKVLIFIIDDVDLLPGEQLIDIATTAIKNMEVRAVKKWLVIREETFSGYTAESKSIVCGFFPDHHKFPDISLYEIVEHRIKSRSQVAKSVNPFSNILCETVTRIYSGNLRESLSALKSILEHVDPKGLKENTNEEFIQQYLNRVSIVAFMREGVLPNLFDKKFRNIPIPIPLDLISLARHVQDESLLFSCVNECANIRHAKSAIKAQGNIEFRLREESFGFSLKQLIDEGLLIKQGKTIHLTPKGEVLSVYADREHYVKDVLAATRPRYFEQTEPEKRFESMCYVNIDHSAIATNSIYWTRVN